MLATLGDLERIYGELPGAGSRLRPALVANRFRAVSGRRCNRRRRRPIETLTAARERVAGWPLHADGFEAFEGGLRRNYRRGRRGFKAAQELPSAEHMHEWRKRVKDLWYHVTLLQDAWRPVLSALADETHELSERLGDEHDVSVLRDWAHEHASALNGGDPLLRGFDAIVADRRRELQERGVRLRGAASTPTARASSPTSSTAGGRPPAAPRSSRATRRPSARPRTSRPRSRA